MLAPAANEFCGIVRCLLRFAVTHDDMSAKDKALVWPRFNGRCVNSHVLQIVTGSGAVLWPCMTMPKEITKQRIVSTPATFMTLVNDAS